MTQSGVYNENKLAWWWAREGKLPDAPKAMQVVLSDTCQQNCHFCAYRMDGNNPYARDGRGNTSNELFTEGAQLAKYGTNNPLRQIPTKRALELLDEFVAAGVLSVEWTGGGEPLLQKDHEQIFAKSLDLGLKNALVTNGVSMKRRLIEDILPQFVWVRISIDAGNKDSYSKIRSCASGHWDIVWRNVLALANAIRKNNSQTVLGLGFVVTPESYQEIVSFVRLAKEHGAGNARLTAMFSPSDEEPFIPIYDEIRALIEEAKGFQGPAFSVYDNFGTRFEDLRQRRPDFPSCPHQYYVGHIGGDLQAYRCCVLAYSKRGKIKGGNLKDHKFNDFWASQERQTDLANLRPKGCERCQFSNKIKAFLYIQGSTASDTLPRHLEFP